MNRIIKNSGLYGILTKCGLALFLIFFGQVTIAQKYYTTEKGHIELYYIYEQQVSYASGDAVSVIFNTESEIIWVTIKCSGFSSDNKRMDKRLFRKNENEFVIKAEMSPENMTYINKGMLVFSMFGVVFNKVGFGTVMISGEFGPSPDDQLDRIHLNMYLSVQSKWMGEEFLKYSGNPVVNVNIDTQLDVVQQ